jgi:hypothetical protein
LTLKREPAKLGELQFVPPSLLGAAMDIIRVELNSETLSLKMHESDAIMYLAYTRVFFQEERKYGERKLVFHRFLQKRRRSALLNR